VEYQDIRSPFDRALLKSDYHRRKEETRICRMYYSAGLPALQYEFENLFDTCCNSWSDIL
jgi:hypothetical protein